MFFQKKEFLIALSFLSWVFLINSECIADNSGSPVDVILQIQKSYIEANVPDQKNFDAFLNRDLRNFFSKKISATVSIEYSLLREGSTQSGTGYPKFYLWVKIFDKGSRVDEGAVRITAIEKTHFVVTDFIDKQQIKKNPQRIKMVFPAALYDSIIERVK